MSSNLNDIIICFDKRKPEKPPKPKPAPRPRPKNRKVTAGWRASIQLPDVVYDKMTAIKKRLDGTIRGRSSPAMENKHLASTQLPNSENAVNQIQDVHLSIGNNMNTGNNPTLSILVF